MNTACKDNLGNVLLKTLRLPISFILVLREHKHNGDRLLYKLFVK